MEHRLEDMLSRIAMETQEIKELEQQLTDGQILANEALRKDLEGIVSGLQHYYKSLRTQTSQVQQKVQRLQTENQTLRHHLEDTHRYCRQLEEQATAHQQTDPCLLQQIILELQTRLGNFTLSQHSDQYSCVQDQDQPQSQSQDSDGTLTETDSQQRKLCLLNRTLQELRRVICESDALSGEQLLWAVDQLKDLNCILDTFQDQCEDDKFSEIQPEMDQTRTKPGSEPSSKPRTDRGGYRKKSRRERRQGGGLKDHIRLNNASMGSGGTHNSGLDLHLLSSPERVLPTGATGNSLNIPQMKEHGHHHTQTNHSEEEPGTHRCSTRFGPAEGAHKQKDRLRSDTEKLQRILRKHRRVLGVCEEVWCVEQTLMKRRAELRQAQRLLQEAHSSREQARCEAEEWQQRAKDSATCLQQTQLQLKELQDEMRTLRKSKRAKIQSPDIDQVWSSDPLASLRNQEEQMQQRIQELRDQETRLKTSLQLLVQQQEALLSQRSSLVSTTAEEEKGLEHLRSELDSIRTELKQVLEEVLSQRQELVSLKTLQSRKLENLQKTQVQLDQTQIQLDQAQDLLDRATDQADQVKTELNQAEDQLDRTKSELLMKQEEVRQKGEEVMEKQRELDQLQAVVERKRTELMELQQEVEMQRMEAESRLKDTERQTRELQEVKEKVEQRKEQSSSLQQQCRHLEDRLRHAHRCLSAVEAELQKLKQEQSQLLLTQQEVIQETAANQEKLNESSELLSFLGEKVEERKVQLQTVEQELSALREKHRQKHSELQELEHRAQASAAVTESEDRGRHVTQEQLHKLDEELWERERKLLEREAEIRHKEEELHQKALEGMDLLPKEEELPSALGNSDEESSEEFYLSTAGLRSASSPEEEAWRMELETDKLELKQDSLKARLRCSLQTQDQSLQERGLETEQSLRGLRHRVDSLDSLLLRAKIHK